jgi:hypothetical protein
VAVVVVAVVVAVVAATGTAAEPGVPGDFRPARRKDAAATTGALWPRDSGAASSLLHLPGWADAVTESPPLRLQSF